ncbi:MAG: S-layer homology domain-containing protein, partial [bacterium]|nr:S-layer homology domain-containing protein [bacterium]
LFEEVQQALAVYDVPWRKTVFQGASSVLRVEVQDDLYGILQYTTGTTTVLTEAAYLSTPAEARLLADPEVQKVEAVAIADGIERYLTTSDPGSGFNPMFSTSRKLSSGGPGGCRDPELGHIGVDEPGFDDVPEGTHRPAIDALRDEGILDGTECGPDLFCPFQPIKRWMMAVWLVRALDGADPRPVTESRFADAPPDRWWTPYVERLAELEVTRGCASGPARFCPYDLVTRGQMASFLTRAFDLRGGLPSGFVDTAGSTHADAIDAVAAAGITRGCWALPPRYCPSANTTKGQMSTLLERALRLVPRASS